MVSTRNNSANASAMDLDPSPATTSAALRHHGDAAGQDITTIGGSNGDAPSRPSSSTSGSTFTSAPSSLFGPSRPGSSTAVSGGPSGGHGGAGLGAGSSGSGPSNGNNGGGPAPGLGGSTGNGNNPGGGDGNGDGGNPVGNPGGAPPPGPPGGPAGVPARGNNMPQRPAQQDGRHTAPNKTHNQALKEVRDYMIQHHHVPALSSDEITNKADDGVWFVMNYHRLLRSTLSTLKYGDEVRALRYLMDRDLDEQLLAAVPDLETLATTEAAEEAWSFLLMIAEPDGVTAKRKMRKGLMNLRQNDNESYMTFSSRVQKFFRQYKAMCDLGYAPRIEPDDTHLCSDDAIADQIRDGLHVSLRAALENCWADVELLDLAKLNKRINNIDSAKRKERQAAAKSHTATTDRLEALVLRLEGKVEAMDKSKQRPDRPRNAHVNAMEVDSLQHDQGPRVPTRPAAPRRTCFVCGSPDHLVRDCTDPRKKPPFCRQCRMHGHVEGPNCEIRCPKRPAPYQRHGHGPGSAPPDTSAGGDGDLRRQLAELTKQREADMVQFKSFCERVEALQQRGARGEKNDKKKNF